MIKHIFIASFFAFTFIVASQNNAIHLSNVHPFDRSKDMKSVVNLAFENKDGIFGFAVTKEKIKNMYAEQSWWQRSLFGSEQDEVAVIRNDDKVIGFITYNNTGYIHTLAVDENHRRQGYGKALVIYALNKFRAKKLDEAYIDTGNPIALNLYKKIGFEEIDKRRNELKHNLTYFNLQNKTAEQVRDEIIFSFVSAFLIVATISLGIVSYALNMQQIN